MSAIVRFHRYLLLPRSELRAQDPASASSMLAEYGPVPSHEAERVALHELARREPSRLIALWTERAPASTAQAHAPNAVRRAVAWLRGELRASTGSMVMLRRKTPRVVGELERSLPPPPPARAPQPPPDRDWIQFEVLDKEGNALSGLPFNISRGQEIVRQGGLDRFGNVYLDRIDPGTLTFALKPDEAPEPLPPTDWIAIELLSEGGRPLPNKAYRLVDAAGTAHEGTSDAHGRILLFDVAPGECTLTLP